jgi:hypothetical protein
MPDHSEWVIPTRLILNVAPSAGRQMRCGLGSPCAFNRDFDDQLRERWASEIGGGWVPRVQNRSHNHHHPSHLFLLCTVSNFLIMLDSMENRTISGINAYIYSSNFPQARPMCNGSLFYDASRNTLRIHHLRTVMGRVVSMSIGYLF